MKTRMAADKTPLNPNKELWEKGDFTRIAASMRDSGAALVKSFGVRNGLKVLDLGCGDGTTAIPTAQLGAEPAVGENFLPCRPAPSHAHTDRKSNDKAESGS
jgi:cyclopropane fatty-acyl-phospholipid synthase-like methyltransferase